MVILQNRATGWKSSHGRVPLWLVAVGSIELGGQNAKDIVLPQRMEKFERQGWLRMSDSPPKEVFLPHGLMR